MVSKWFRNNLRTKYGHVFGVRRWLQMGSLPFFQCFAINILPIDVSVHALAPTCIYSNISIYVSIYIYIYMESYVVPLFSPELTKVTKNTFKSLWLASRWGVDLVALACIGVRRWLQRGSLPFFLCCAFEYVGTLQLWSAQGGCTYVRNSKLPRDNRNSKHDAPVQSCMKCVVF